MSRTAKFLPTFDPETPRAEITLVPSKTARMDNTGSRNTKSRDNTSRTNANRRTNLITEPPR